MLVEALRNSDKILGRDGNFWWSNSTDMVFLSSDKEGSHVFIGILNPNILKFNFSEDQMNVLLSKYLDYKPKITIFNIHKAFDMLNIKSSYSGIKLKRRLKGNSYAYVGYIKNNIQFEFRFTSDQLLASNVNTTLVEYFKNLSWVKSTEFGLINKIYNFIGVDPKILVIKDSELGKTKTIISKYRNFDFNSSKKQTTLDIIKYINSIMDIVCKKQINCYNITINGIQISIYNNKISIKLPGSQSIIIYKTTNTRIEIDSLYSLFDDLDIELFLNKLELYKLKNL